MRARRHTLFFLFSVLVLLLCVPPALLVSTLPTRAAGSTDPVHEASGDPTTPGALQVQQPDGTLVEMPLRHTAVSIEVTAFVARATIEQVFENPFDHPVEAVYIFPLGDRAAVDDFELAVGDRTIRGVIQRREEARATYRAARAAGYRAALLEQERPNIFRQCIANLEPGKPVTVRLRTVETLRYERGLYRLTFPLVVGPRYIPGGASRSAIISAPMLPPGTRSGHDVDITVSIDAGVPLTGIESPSHRVLVDNSGSTTARVRLAPDDTIPNKDFLLRWSVSAERPAVGLLTHRDGLDGFFTLLVQPKGDVTAAEAAPKEITFVVDTSGSMSGIPIEASKRLIARALHELGPRDTFNLVRFSGDNEVYSKDPLPNDRASIEAAIAWLQPQQGHGGTEMLPALRAAFARPVDPNRVRLVVFFTDGYVGNDSQILASIREVLGDARIYTIGIGSSVNHYLLDRMADLGRGAYVFVRPDDNADDALEAFKSWVTRPYLTDLSIDWGALPVADVQPERPHDLSSGQTLTIVGRYLSAGEGDVVVRGKLGGRYWEKAIHVALPERETRHSALASLWARARIEELLLLAPGAAPASVRAEVTDLALEYRLMSPFTSFVAVDDSTVVNPTGTAETVVQALPIPDGVSYAGVFGSGGPAALQALGEDDAPEDARPSVQVPRQHTVRAVVPPQTTVAPVPPPLLPPTPPTQFGTGVGGLKIRVIDYADKSPIIGAAITLSSMKRYVAPTAILSDKNGEVVFPSLRAGDGYVITVIMDGYAGLRQDAQVTTGKQEELVIALGPEHVEKVTIIGDKTTVDLDSSQQATRYTSEFIENLPVADHYYQSGLSLAPGAQVPDGDGDPNIDGARERDFKMLASLGYIGPPAPPPPVVPPSDTTARASLLNKNDGATLLSSRTPVLDAALRVLADLADDGKLSPSEGKPALAALLGAQRRSGAIADDVAVHAIATWALAEAAEALPRDPWVASARKMALDYLVASKSGSGWPARRDGDVDAEATRWARLVLSRLSPTVVAGTVSPAGEASASYARLHNALATGTSRVSYATPVGHSAFDRLVASIAKRHLKLVGD